MMIDLSAKRVVITGGGSGIGKDLAEGFAAAGATVVVGSRTSEQIQAVAAGINQRGGTAHAITIDVTDPDQVTQFAQRAIEVMGGIDILINNAGVAKSHKFANHQDALWHQMLAVNLTGVYYVTKAFVPAMLAQKWGRIITVASVAAKVGGKYIAAYSASKHGVLGLTRSLALELAPHITVNAICPGYVETPMTDATIANITSRTGADKEQAIAALVEQNPQRRLVQPTEITALALYLASEAAGGINGQGLNVDGGSVMS
jgi:NAD(P)-dependent dehydrogenase (short-subunit alcohol dehydrogenase family)